jgi:signal peptidase I
VLISAGIVVGVLVVIAAVLSPNYQGFFVPSLANEPTLKPGDHVMMHKGHSDIHRGDLIVFQSPEAGRLVIMRVVGVGGDELSDVGGHLFVNGAKANEGYLAKGTTTSGVPDITVPPGSVYVLGDNRNDSADSRSYGPVPMSSVRGRLAFRYWPLGRLGGV